MAPHPRSHFLLTEGQEDVFKKEIKEAISDAVFAKLAKEVAKEVDEKQQGVEMQRQIELVERFNQQQPFMDTHKQAKILKLLSDDKFDEVDDLRQSLWTT